MRLFFLILGRKEVGPLIGIDFLFPYLGCMLGWGFLVVMRRFSYFWPCFTYSSAELKNCACRRLAQARWEIRQSLPHDIVQAATDAIYIEPDTPLWVDAE